jgi:hypothetical protein
LETPDNFRRAVVEGKTFVLCAFIAPASGGCACTRPTKPVRRGAMV